jgi:hypothetical protein
MIFSLKEPVRGGENRSVGLGPGQCDGMVFEGFGAVANCEAKLPEFLQKGKHVRRLYDWQDHEAGRFSRSLRSVQPQKAKHLLPSLSSERLMQPIGMMPTIVFDFA